MRIQNLIIILALAFISFESFGQKVNSFDLEDRIWGVKFYHIIHLEESDTIPLNELDKKDEAYFKPYGYGFIINNDGTFEEIRKRNCGFDREGYKGEWNLKAKTLKLIVEGKIWIQMDILKIDENELISTNWKIK